MGTTDSSIHKREWFEKRFNLSLEMGKSLDKEKLISEFCLDNQSTRRTALDFIKHFINCGYMLEISDQIVHKLVYADYLEENSLKGAEEQINLSEHQASL